MIESIAGAATQMSASRLATDYSVSVAKKAMDSQELAARALLDMLPDTPPLGEFIDTYA